MHRCACECCKPDAPGKTYTQRYRLFCEVKYVLNKNQEQQEDYLSRIEKRRGFAARKHLQSAMERVREQYRL